MYIIVSEWAKSTTRPCEASERRGGKVRIRGFLYGKHLHWSWRSCTFTTGWVRITGLVQHPLLTQPVQAHCFGWARCKSKLRNLTPFPEAVTLFTGGYSKQTFETTVFCHHINFPLEKHLVNYPLYISFRMDTWDMKVCVYTKCNYKLRKDFFCYTLYPASSSDLGRMVWLS